MPDWLQAYTPTLAVLALTGLLLCLQLLVLDVAGIRSGHRPGSPIGGGPEDFLFRAWRAHANTNESLGAFIALALAGLLSGASPAGMNLLCFLYLCGRISHMLFYYAGWSRPRSLAFGLSLGALFAMAALVLFNLLT